MGCTVLAALLHYFLLALFCWMLCEGVLLYILLVKVFGGGAEDKVKYFYLFGWGKPVYRSLFPFRKHGINLKINDQTCARKQGKSESFVSYD